MKTLADYWQDACSTGTGSLGRLPPQQQAAHLLIFLGGFAACVNTMASLANVSGEEAERHLRELYDELTQMTDTATRTALGGTIQ